MPFLIPIAIVGAVGLVLGAIGRWLAEDDALTRATKAQTAARTELINAGYTPEQAEAALAQTNKDALASQSQKGGLLGSMFGEGITTPLVIGFVAVLWMMNNGKARS